MSALSKHDLGQLRHVDLLALAIEASVAPSTHLLFRLGSLSSEALVDALTQPEASERLAARAGTRLDP